MLKLYGSDRSRASIVHWYLEELGIPYEFVTLDLKAGEHRQSDYLAINPMGKVPALVEEEFKVWESGAILLYLAEKYGNLPESLAQRGLINQWVLFANSTLGTGLLVEANREKEMPKLLNPLNQIFEKQPFLVGEELTVADIAVGSILSYVPLMFNVDLSAYPAVMDYLQRITERPAFQNSIGKRFG